MRVRLGWPDCDNAGTPVDAFWVECTPEESSRFVEPRMSDIDRDSIRYMSSISYGWPHRFEGEDRCCFLVARDLRFITAYHAHYPFHPLWNAYSPFREVPDTVITSLDELADLPKAGDPEE